MSIDIRRGFPKFYRVIQVEVEEDNGESREYSCLADERGTVYSKEDVKALFEEVKQFYMREDMPNIDDYNKDKKLLDYMRCVSISLEEDEMGKYLIPKARYIYKKFNSDKRNWSFKCDWCGEKVSSKTNEGYYSAYDRNFKGNSFDRGCSEDCAKLIWKDNFKHWVHEHGYSKFFA
ncbi:hypothetical protein [Bacillus sp. CDB3]|uniref:hypothetical protein n=1 Tax=Bacillus sp. CDB3 TaxID=360310 RepID=UPI0009D7DAB8|nr:hypothetical protein [Bacillus sp. CDB3]OQR53434.1 hypothetical protein CDB3_29805 [Bacillus sp. CDB3]